MNHKLDLKSMIIGFLGAALLISFSFTNDKSSKDTVDTRNGINEMKSSNAGENGRYQTIIRDRMTLILDTQTGKYIIGVDVKDFGKVTWVKGDFESTYNTGLDNKKEIKQ
ncbi:hypothetical protein PBAL39_22300 [Pedobacter sp. BAL39]|uniref:hypothetical protein n=1 Tax=Pedobacter sp. BAL39 TaxID=391596 RepID=UPI00015595B0|nr:hypothetical protein [Pedobacter sp. BAL39]EDM38851.1 hypothetical protein PBAL39_22300 [Pedobacter sp. BAL39]